MDKQYNISLSAKECHHVLRSLVGSIMHATANKIVLDEEQYDRLFKNIYAQMCATQKETQNNE